MRRSQTALGETELFNLVKLVDAENAANVLSAGTGLLAKARTDAGVSEGQRLFVHPRPCDSQMGCSDVANKYFSFVPSANQ